MIMKKISDRVYEFFELGPEDENKEVTEVVSTSSEDEIDYSKYEYYFSEDFCCLKEDYCKYPIEDDSITEEESCNELVLVSSKPKSKRDEILESLSYLKNKKVKTKQDRESIYTLEVILKNTK